MVGLLLLLLYLLLRLPKKLYLILLISQSYRANIQQIIDISKYLHAFMQKKTSWMSTAGEIDFT